MRGTLWAAALAGAAGLLLQAGAAHAQQAAPKAAAVVNGETISVADVETVIKSRGPIPVEIPAEKRKALRREVLEMMIDRLLMEQFLRRQGPKVDEAEVNKRMAEMEQGLKMTGKSLADFCKATDQTEKQVRAVVGQLFQWESYVRGRVSDQDVKRYYDDNKDFFDGVTVHASHILVRVPLTATEAERQAARQRLLAIRQQVVGGQVEFAEAAKKYSECPSAKEGGDIGSFPRKMVVEETFAKAAFALPVGQVSDVVTTDFGMHIIKVTERKLGEQPSEFGKIKDVVRDFCIEELRQAVLAHQRKGAKIDVYLGP